MPDWIVIFGWLGGPATVIGGLYWGLKEGLIRSLDRTLERYKAELQRQNDSHRSDLNARNEQQVERLKAELSFASQQELERLKAELALQSESIRHQYQMDQLKLATANKQKHEVYASLLEKIRFAEGAVGSLWGARFAPGLDQYTDEELASFLNEKSVSPGRRDDLLAGIKQDRTKGMKEVQKIVRNIELSEARGKVTEAKNFILLKALYATADLKRAALAITGTLWNTWTEVHVGELNPTGSGFEKYQALLDKAREQVEALEEAMRKELSPLQV